MTQDMRERRLPADGHRVTIEGRSRAVFSGVKDVEEFDEGQICMITVMGKITVLGGELHISRLDLAAGELAAEGRIDSIEYEDAEEEPSRGFFGRLFR